MAKMFVNYSGSKSDFSKAGLETTYNNSIVFIGNGECVYTHGKYYGNVEEAIATLKYFSAIKVGDTVAEAAGRDGIITFASNNPQEINIDVTAKGLTFGLSQDFLNGVDAKAVKTEVNAAIEALEAVDNGFKSRLEALESALGIGEGGEGEEDPSVTAQIASLSKAISDEETARTEADNAINAALAGKVNTTDYSAKVAELNAAIEAKVAQTVYDAKVAELEQADTDNLAEAKAHATGLNTAMNTRMEAVEGDITTLKGGEAVEGSVDYKVKEAIDAFAEKISDNGIVDTFKELVDYAAANGSTVATLVSDNNTNKQNIANNTAAIGENAEAIAKEVEDREAAIETLSGTVSSNHSAAMAAAQDASTAASTADGKAVSAQNKADENAELLATLNGANTVEGSIKKQIKDAIDAEAATRSAADATLQSNIDKKVAQSAYNTKVGEIETELGKKLATSTYNTDKEALEASIATKVAQTAYDTKVGELSTGISDNATAIENEVNRAKAAEEGNATAITNEANRADAAEKAIDAKLGTKADDSSKDTAFGRIAALEADIEDLTGGNGTIAEQLAAFKEANVDPVSAVANANTTAIAKLNGSATTDGSYKKGDADTLASAKSYADDKAADAKSGAEATAASALSSAVTTLNAEDARLAGLIQGNTAAIATLNGTGEGSVDKKISDAINDFATKVTDGNATVDTFKELVDYVAEHGTEFGAALGRITAVEGKANNNETAISTINGTGEGSIKKAVADEATLRSNADTTLQNNIDAVSAVANAAATKTALQEEVNRAKAAEQAASDAAAAAQEDADTANAAIAAMSLTAVSGYIKSVSQTNGKVSATKVDAIPAADVTVADSGNKFTATTVEAALAELADMWAWEEL